MYQENSYTFRPPNLAFKVLHMMCMPKTVIHTQECVPDLAIRLKQLTTDTAQFTLNFPQSTAHECTRDGSKREFLPDHISSAQTQALKNTKTLLVTL
jgi:hypothetical protein